MFVDNVKDFLCRYTDRLLRCSSLDLVVSTRVSGTPWGQTFEVSNNGVIPKAAIKSYFKAL